MQVSEWQMLKHVTVAMFTNAHRIYIDRNAHVRERNSFYHPDPDTQTESTPDVVVLFYHGGRKGYRKANLNLP